ncbi:MAG: hypothetical protein ACI33K_10240 [Clostridiaceae bacterium]
MTRKVTISLADHVYSLASKKADILMSGNFSSYINSLICKDFTREELEKEAWEIQKPEAVGRTIVAKENSPCEVCYKAINIGEVICSVELNDGKIHWVHASCCRKAMNKP